MMSLEIKPMPYRPGFILRNFVRPGLDLGVKIHGMQIDERDLKRALLWRRPLVEVSDAVTYRVSQCFNRYAWVRLAHAEEVASMTFAVQKRFVEITEALKATRPRFVA